MSSLSGRSALAFALWCAVLPMAGCNNGGDTSGTSGTNAGMVDRQAPLIESFSPACESYALAGERVTFAVDTQEDESLQYQWIIDGVPQTVQDREMVVETAQGNVGVHTISVNIAGSGEESTSVVWQLRLVAEATNQAPAITSAMPNSALSLVQGEGASFSLAASDPDANDVISCRWYLDGVEQAATALTWRMDSSTVWIGNHLVEAVLSDGHEHGAGGGASHSWTVTVEDSPPTNHSPVLHSVAPDGDLRIGAGTTLRLEVRASDDDGDSLTYRWTVDGIPQSTTAAALSYAPEASQVGAHVIRVKVDDRKANSDGSDPLHAWNITVDPTDTIPDTGSSEGPGNPQEPLPSTAEVRLAWDPVTRDIEGRNEYVAGYRIYIARSPGAFDAPACTVGTPEAVLRSLSHGIRYYIAVTAYDESGNESAFSQPIEVAVP